MVKWDAAQVAASCSPPARRGLAVEASTHCRQGEDKLIGMELPLDTGKKLQSMPKQFTNDPSIVSKVNVVVLTVPSFAHGQYFEAFAPHMKPEPSRLIPARSGGDVLLLVRCEGQGHCLRGFGASPVGVPFH